MYYAHLDTPTSINIVIPLFPKPKICIFHTIFSFNLLQHQFNNRIIEIYFKFWISEEKITWTEYLTARLATESPRRIRWDIANLLKLLSFQKLPDVGFPTISFNFHGALKDAVWISLSEAIRLQILQTQEARAKSVIGSFSKMRLRMSLQNKAEKFEFIGEIAASVIMAGFFRVLVVEDVMRDSWRRLSSSSILFKRNVGW